MYCPNCKARAYTLETRHSSDENYTMRENRCPVCRTIFYSEEKLIVKDADVNLRWKKISRNKKVS